MYSESTWLYSKNMTKPVCPVLTLASLYMTLALSYQVHRSNLRLTWVKNQVNDDEIRQIRLRLQEERKSRERASLSTTQIDLDTFSHMLDRLLAVLMVSPASTPPPPPTHGHGKLLSVCTSINLLIGEVLDPVCFY